jgi:myo-inositol 2-dehydrogenase/D-chiro-inositol 1-dehydrogenase
MTVRVGVIGTGIMGSDHARLLHTQVAGSKVSGVADLDERRAGAVASRLGADVFTTAEDLINSASVDAVVIASHDSAHARQLMSCLQAGKPVLCEKPMATTLSECENIVAAQRALNNPVDLVSVGFMRRFHPNFIALKAKVNSGDLGVPLMILGSHRNVVSYPEGGSEGTITNSAVHDIDITSWLLDSPVVEVSWHGPKTTPQDRSRQDPQLLHLRTADGVLTSVDVFVNARYGYEVRYEVVCEFGSARLSPNHLITIDHGQHSGNTHSADWRPFFADAYRLELQAWVDAITAGRSSSLATAVEGLGATRAAQALVASMHQGGRTVRVDAVPLS